MKINRIIVDLRRDETPSFADRLNLLISLSFISISELVARSGLSSQHVHQLLDGTNAKPSFEAVCKLADALGVSTEAFRSNPLNSDLSRPAPIDDGGGETYK